MSKPPKTLFRLYQIEKSKMDSSFFDLIDGNLETKQTKGLAYLFSLSPEFLKRFIKVDRIEQQLKNESQLYKKVMKSDLIKIDAEQLSEGKVKLRRDITITFYKDNQKIFVCIIEAKSIKGKNNHNIEKQLSSYIDQNYFPEDANTPKIVISLTKIEQFFKNPNFISITWIQLIQALHETIKRERDLDDTKILLLKDYYNFITGVDKSMNFYEKEVLSVSAGETFNEISKYYIHACPVSYNYRDSLFITFRQKKGIMDKLYKIEDMIEFDPRNDTMVHMALNRKIGYEKRLKSYLEDRIAGYGYRHEGLYRFYILSETEYISLHHKPRPEKNNTGPRYYTLAELLSGKEIVYTK